MRKCDLDGCSRPHKARGLCAFHYNRKRRLGEPKEYLAPYEKERPKECSVIGCEEPTRTGALCNPHYLRWLRHGDPVGGERQRRKRGTPPATCSLPGCDGVVLSRGWCSRHYARWKRYGNPVEVNHSQQRQTCIVEGCDSLWMARGYCRKHYRRWKTHGDPHIVIQPTRSETWKRDPNGYLLRYWPEHPNANGSRRVSQHVAVMSEYLGRPLRKGETVHHKNGIRHDNRIENLELWKNAHGPGQRVTDLLAWAHALIEEYADDPKLWPEGLMP